MSGKPKRFTLELGKDGEKTLEEIRVATATSSMSEVVRDALALYEMFVAGAQKGDRIFIGKVREGSSEVVTPSLYRASKFWTLT